jgi:cytochrome b involved in lipid metabolism
MRSNALAVQWLSLLCLSCCVIVATARVAVQRLTADVGAVAAAEPLHATLLRLGAAAAGIALAAQLAWDWNVGVADPTLKPEQAEVAEPTSDGAETLTLREDLGTTKAVPLYPAIPANLAGAPLPKYSMEEVSKHNTRDDCWVVLDGRVYDVTKFISRHPGGVGPITNMAGKDATDVFDNYHAARVYKQMLPSFLVGEATNVIVYDHVADFRKARQEMLRRGLFETDMRYYAKMSCWYAFLFLSALCLSLGYVGGGGAAARLLGAAVMGIFWQQLAGLGHDLGHSGVTHNFHTDHLIGSALSALMGLSVGWWKSDHNTHHVVCNAIEHDPNIQHLPVLAITDKIFAQPKFWDTYHRKWVGLDAFGRLLVSYQHLLFYPLMAFGRINLYVQGFVYILSGHDRHHYPKLELLGLCSFFAWVGVLAKVQPSWSLAVGWIIVSHAVSGILHVQIVLSHWSMETYKGSPYTSKETEWYLMQMRTTMNVDTHPLLDWAHIGLQFQLEHHLFPRLPRHNLRKARVLVKAICEKHGIHYHEPGFLQGNLEMCRALKTAALAARKTTRGDGGFFHSKLWDGLNLSG